MEPVIHRISAWDGLPLCVLEWPATRGGAIPLLCLPGLVRTACDFARLAFRNGRRVVSIDYPGRGRSGRSHDPRRYDAEACLRDVLDICAALHLQRVAVIGTSFGGLLAMAMAVARPGLIAAVVLNDIGPEIGQAGADFVRRFVGHDPALPDLAGCVAYLRSILPPLSLETDEDWNMMARLTYSAGSDGRYHPVWDIRVAELMGSVPDLWRLFGALAGKPLLLLRGAASNVLLAETVVRMLVERPDMEVIEVPGVGHAPTLMEPAVVDGIQTFLERAG